MDKSTYITINDGRVAGVLDFKMTLSRELEEVNGAFSAKATLIKATIKRARPLSGANDGINLRALSDFKLSLHTPDYVSNLTGCCWENFSESVEENRIIEEMKLSALKYAMSV